MTEPLEPQQFAAWAATDKYLDFTMSPVVTITGWAITWKLVPSPGATAIMTKTASVVSGPAGTFRVTIAKADWATLPEGVYIWQAFRADSGSEDVVAHGTVEVRARA